MFKIGFTVEAIGDIHKFKKADRKRVVDEIYSRRNRWFQPGDRANSTNEKLMKFLGQRAKQTKTISLRDVKEQLGLSRDWLAILSGISFFGVQFSL